MHGISTIWFGLALWAAVVVVSWMLCRAIAKQERVSSPEWDEFVAAHEITPLYDWEVDRW